MLDKEKQFELEKLDLQNAAEINSLTSNAPVSEVKGIQRINLKSLVPKFNRKLIDITIFFMCLERQAEKSNILVSDCVYHLILLHCRDNSERACGERG